MVYSKNNDKHKASLKLQQIFTLFLKIGAISFGGGATTIAFLQKYLVIDKNLITEDDLAVAVTLGQLIPGPFIPNYVEYVGYQLKGIKGMIVSVVGFLLPGTLAMIGLSAWYFSLANAEYLRLIFRYLAPAIIGILIWATLNICRWYIKNSRDLFVAILALILSIIRISPVIIVLGCGLLGILYHMSYKKTNALLTGLFCGSLPMSNKLFNALTIGGIFFYIGSISFGGGYAAIPFILKETSILRNWLTYQELLVGVAFSQITPGPVALLSTFVGYKVLGILGALVATIAIFLPATLILYLILLTGKYLKDNRRFNFLSTYLEHFINGVKPSIAGYMIFTVVAMGINNSVLNSQWIFNLLFIIISFLLIQRFKLNPIWIILGAIAIGLILTVF
ncbi:MAG: chromate efflux transporter [candidate division WOR-3 bacterium]